MSEKIEQFYRDATADDIARVMNGEAVEARFKSVNNDWLTAYPREGHLVGWSSYDKIFPFIDDNGDHYQFCQVYDPPEWFVNKPDPGKGWRLLEKFPPEPKLGTDEVWRLFKTWEATANDNGVQEEDCWYRRRIESAAPTIKICDPLEIGAMYANADTTRFRKFVDTAKAGELSFTCSFVWQPLPEPVSVEAGHRIKHPNGCLIEITEDGIKINELIDIKLRRTQS
jgi:hypothetical protein